MRTLRTINLLSFSMICLTGCTLLKPAPVVQYVLVPNALLTCKPEPLPPPRPGPGLPRSQIDIGNFIIDALDAGDDCRSKLARIRESQREKMVLDKGA